MPTKKIYNLKELEKEFKNQWILVEVIEDDKLTRPKKVRLITRSKNRNQVYEAMMKVPDGTHVATLYAGPPLRKGYAAAF